MGAVPIRVTAESRPLEKYMARRFDAHMRRLSAPGYRFTTRDFYSGNASARRGALLAAGLLVMGGGASARYDGPPESRLTREQLLRNFELIVFHNEFDERVDTRLRKWTAPVKIYLDIRAGDRATILNVMERHVRHLARITDHDIHFVSDPKAANVAVVVGRAARPAQVEDDSFKDGLELRQVMQPNL